MPNASNSERVELDDLEKFVERIARFAIDDSFVFRGEAKIYPTLQPGIDRVLRSDDPENLQKEQDLIRAFHERAFKFLGSTEQHFLRQRKEDHVVRLTVMQHFGAPTRLLDWTRSIAVAAYFACIDDSSSDGVIWWLKPHSVEQYVDENWGKWGFLRWYEKEGLKKSEISESKLGLSAYDLEQVDYNDHIFKPICAEFVSMVHLILPFPRAQAQRGLFTIGSRLSMAHDIWLRNTLDSDQFGKMIISSRIKQDVISYLRQMGIDAISLQHAGADQVGNKMKWELTPK